MPAKDIHLKIGHICTFCQALIIDQIEHTFLANISKTGFVWLDVLQQCAKAHLAPQQSIQWEGRYGGDTIIARIICYPESPLKQGCAGRSFFQRGGAGWGEDENPRGGPGRGGAKKRVNQLIQNFDKGA